MTSGGSYILEVEIILIIPPPTVSFQELIIFFMFCTDYYRIGECNIKTIDLSDHSPISMFIKLERKIRKILRKLNSNILNDSKIRETLYLELNDTGEVSQTVVWDTLKAVMRGKIISVTTYLEKNKGAKTSRPAGKKGKQLQNEESNKGNAKVKGEIKKLKGEIDNIFTQDTQEKKMLFLKQKYYEIGSKSTKLLAYKLCKQRVENTIYKIQNPHTKAIENKLEKIQESFELYYQALYSQPQASNETQIEDFFKNTRTSSTD